MDENLFRPEMIQRERVPSTLFFRRITIYTTMMAIFSYFFIIFKIISVESTIPIIIILFFLPC
ncbi:TPA: hypothetical protein MIQ49_09635 [Klebsiella pneumoniae]|nr:hypothetical protein AT479_04735 [Klebsiella pneumoniae]HBY1567100.1 hypothetical protein [Klebsiella pneumoniae]